MNIAATDLLVFVSGLGLALALVLLRSFVPAYLTQKGQNTASKEDLAQLTQIVESIKASSSAQIERLRADLMAEGQVIERRRRIYEELCAGLRVFQAGHGSTNDAKERFHAAHSAAWLWAPDPVLLALNMFIQLKVQEAKQPGSVDQDRLKDAYATAVLAMRRDAGFQDTKMLAVNYEFVQFT